MDTFTTEFLLEAQKRLKTHYADIQIPPPVFTLMDGEIIAFDAEKMSMSIKFPVKEAFQNPYGSMQGGMIVTAMDNIIGPIALMHEDLNVTKKLEVDYVKMITKDQEFIIVDACFVSREGKNIYYEAKAHDGAGRVFTTAKAHHRVVRFS